MTDVLVIGAGIFGLSVAYAAHRAGMSVRVLNREGPGAGASGGIVGALTPHAPTKWRPMMAYQFAALATLAERIASIERASGIATGYGRVGRIAPLTDAAAAERAQKDANAAREVWGDAAQMKLRSAPDWIAPEFCAFGVLFDNLSARVMPHRYVAALVASLPEGTIERAEVTAVEGRTVCTGAGERTAGHVVLAPGADGWALLPPRLRGSGVKGQAALLDADLRGHPVITHSGLYIIPHADGTVAVGSTSEKSWATTGTDEKLDDILGRAVALVPALAGRRRVAPWAGIRPRPPGREPLVGAVPGQRGLWLATGGFRIGLGIAHAVGDALVADIVGERAAIPLPESFRPVA